MESLENNEETNLSKRLGSSVLDDDIFRMYRELIHQFATWTFLPESDKVEINRVQNSFKERNGHFTGEFQDAF